MWRIWYLQNKFFLQTFWNLIHEFSILWGFYFSPRTLSFRLIFLGCISIWILNPGNSATFSSCMWINSCEKTGPGPVYKNPGGRRSSAVNPGLFPVRRRKYCENFAVNWKNCAADQSRHVIDVIRRNTCTIKQGVWKSRAHRSTIWPDKVENKTGIVFQKKNWSWM